MTAPPSLAGAAFLADPALRRVIAALGAEGEARIVGGAVRNALLGAPVADIDVATTLAPARVMALAEAAGLGVVPTGLRFGTVTVLAGEAAFEVTTLRRDVRTDGRWAEVAFGTDWAADAARRDFTMNALSCDGEGRVHDPLGGFGDLLARRVRFIGDADRRLREDHLRALRFFRFHAEYGAGEIDRDGFLACARARPLIDRLSAERLRQELMKLLVAPGGIEAAALLAETGILSDLVGAPEFGRLRRLAAVEESRGLAPDAVRRLAALGVRLPEDAWRLRERLALSRREEARLVAMAGHAPPLARSPNLAAGRLARYRAGADFPDVTAMAEAIAGPSARAAFDAFVKLAGEPAPVLPVRGADLVGRGVPPGPELGRRLAALERRWIDGGFALGRDELLAAEQP